MTVAAGVRKTQYTGTGANTVLSTVFPFFESGDLVVEKRITATGVVTVLVEGVHYSVTEPDTTPGVGSITPLAGSTDFPATVTWTIVRTTEISQETDYVENDSFPAESHEQALDRLTLIVQEVNEEASRGLAFPVTDSVSIDPTLPSSVDRASKILYFDATGAPTPALLSTISPSSVVFSSLGQSIATIANAAALKALLDYTESYGNTVEYAAANTLANRPAAPTGKMLYYSTDERAFYYSGGVSWTDRLSMVEIGTYANLAVTAPFLGITTDRKQLYLGDGAALQLIRSLPPRYIGGFQLSRTGNDSLTIGSGSCRNVLFVGAGNAADQINLIRTSSLQKDTSATWVAGAAGGMLATGVSYAAGWYHVFAISKVDGTTDFALDTDVAGVNLLDPASSTVVAGYSWARRIGSILINSGANITPFVQSGDTFLWQDPSVLTLDNAISSTDDTAGKTASLENVPPGVVVEAILNVQAGSGATGAGGYYISSGLIDSVAPSASAAPLANLTAGSVSYGTMRVLTDGAATPLIRYRALTDTSQSLGIIVTGWVDNRGRDY